MQLATGALSKRRHTFEVDPATVRFNIFAFRGIAATGDRESQLSGFAARVLQSRRNINGKVQ